MTALPTLATEDTIRAAIARLSRISLDAARVVSCYLKLEPRDKTRGKYLIKMKNRVKRAAAEVARLPLERPEREAVAADLERVRRYFDDPGRLPSVRHAPAPACAQVAARRDPDAPHS